MTVNIYESDLSVPFIPPVSLFDFLFPDTPGVSATPDFGASSTVFIDGLTGDTLSRGQIREDALRLKTGLNALGIKRGGTALLWGFNSFHWIQAAYGCLAAGLTMSPANAAYAPEELAHQINDSGAEVIFVSPDSLPSLRQALPHVKRSFPDSRIVLLCQPRDKPAAAKSLKCMYEIMGAPAKEAEHFDGLEADETVVLCYSSGTTGLPKGVMTTHRNLVTQLITSVALYPDITPEQDKVLAFLPMSHVYGLIVHLLFPLSSGIATVVIPRFDETSAYRAIEKYRITMGCFVPPVVLLMVHSAIAPKYDLSSLKYISCGAAPLGPDLCAAFRKRYPNSILMQSYGMTETSPGIFLCPPADAQNGHLGIGRLVPSFQARLVREDGSDAPRGERGELWVRGPNVMKGYHNNPAATAKTMEPGGWLKTGDVLICDKDGLWAVVDRVKELIKYKGFQVAPAELEGLLLQHPKVIDAGVVGVYDDSQATELPRGYIVPNPSAGVKTPADQAALAKEVGAWLAARVAHHKKLAGGVKVIEVIPKSPSGKILRNILREAAKKEFVAEAPSKL